MILRPLSAVCLALLSSGSAYANVTFSLEADLLKTDTGLAAPVGSLFLLVASTSDSSFSISNNIAGAPSTNIGTYLGGDDMIVYRGNLTSAGRIEMSGISLDLTDPSYGGVFDSGDRLALVWVPSLSGSASALSADSRFGFYDGGIAAGHNTTDSDSSGVDGSSSWITPTDGNQSKALGLYTQDASLLGPGSNPADVGNALGVVGVPEPSAALLGLLGALSLFCRTRK